MKKHWSIDWELGVPTIHLDGEYVERWKLEDSLNALQADHEAVTRYKEALERLDGMGWFLHTHFEERECPHCIAHAALVTSQAGDAGAPAS